MLTYHLTVLDITSEFRDELEFHMERSNLGENMTPVARPIVVATLLAA